MITIGAILFGAMFGGATVLWLIVNDGTLSDQDAGASGTGYDSEDP